MGKFFEKIFMKFIDCKRWKLYSHLVFAIITFLKRVKAKLKKMIVFFYFKQLAMLSATWSSPGMFWHYRQRRVCNFFKKIIIFAMDNFFAVFYSKLLKILFRRLWFLPSTILIIYCLSIEILFNPVIRCERWRNICLRLRLFVRFIFSTKWKYELKMANITNYSRSNFVKKGLNSVKVGVFLSGLLLWTKKLFLQETAFFSRSFYQR